jgi:hypothetical protein
LPWNDLAVADPCPVVTSKSWFGVIMNELKVKIKVGCHRGAVNSRGDRPVDHFVFNFGRNVPSVTGLPFRGQELTLRAFGNPSVKRGATRPIETSPSNSERSV